MKPYFLAVGLLSIIVLNCGCLENEEGNDTIVTMNLKEFFEDFSYSINNETNTVYYYYMSLNENDILIIRDTLSNVSYLEEDDHTLLFFVSLPDDPIAVEGNITDEYTSFDEVRLELSIVNVSFEQIDANTNILWTISLETVHEGWDYETNQYVPFPQKYLYHT